MEEPVGQRLSGDAAVGRRRRRLGRRRRRLPPGVGVELHRRDVAVDALLRPRPRLGPAVAPGEPELTLKRSKTKRDSLKKKKLYSTCAV